METVVEPFHHWFPIALSGLCSFLINAAILKREITTRNSQTILFASKYLKIWSILSIASGVVFGFSIFTRYINILCNLSWPMVIGSVISQTCCMGFYQLSRLYYCFSQNKIHSHKGYPTCLFICFYAFGSLLMINGLIYPWILFHNLGSCGINKELEAYRTDYLRPRLWMNFSALMFLLWDWATLLLYISKAATFRKYKFENDQVYNRVQSILVRILILTLFYEMITVLSIAQLFILGMIPHWIYNIVYNILYAIASVFINISMFLMQQHNGKEYRTFLSILYGTKLHFMCCGCCYESIIEYDLKTLDTKPSVGTNVASIESTMYETHDISKDHGKINRPRAFSPQTETVVV